MKNFELSTTLSNINITKFSKDPLSKMIQNAVTSTSVEKLSVDRDLINSIDDTVSERLDCWKVTYQQKSGRCWLFAALNVLRVKIMSQLNIEDFSFSQNYLYFFDKLEKFNHFLAAVERTAERPLDDREVMLLFEYPVSDGGYWKEAVDLVRKYGVVPSYAMPDTHSATDSAEMNKILFSLARKAGLAVRNAVAENENTTVIRQKAIDDFWRVLAIHLGTPVKNFIWHFRDKDKNYRSEGTFTPAEFTRKYIAEDLDNLVVLCHDPRPENPTKRLYAISGTAYMEGQKPYEHLSVDLKLLKTVVISALRDGEPVWFTCDVKTQFDKDLGIWDAKLHDYNALYGVNFDLDKAERLRCKESSMTHAMTFVGVDLINDKPVKWRVENSWGEDCGKKGFFTMNDNWFDEYVFQVIVDISRIPAELHPIFEEEPIMLPRWDALGSEIS